MHQGGNTKYERVSKMSEKSMLETVKNCYIYIYILNTASCVGCLGSDMIL